MPYRTQDDRIEGVVVTFVDVAEIKQAEEALREALERAAWLARFPGENPNPVMRTSAEGTILYCNPASIKNQDWACSVGDLLPDPVRTLVAPAMAAGEELHREVQLGENFYAVTLAPFPEESYVNVYGREITKRKQAEESLRRSEERLKRAQEIAHLGSWELDLVDNRLIWSDEVYRIFGLEPQEFAATYEAFLERVHPDDREAVDAAYSGSIRENRDTYEIEHRVIRKDTGEIRFVHERCQHFRDASGTIIRSVGMVHDITERKRAEEALRKLNAELEERVAEQTAEIRRTYEAVEAERQRFYNVLETLPAYVVLLTPDYHVPFANRFFRERFGESQGKRCYEYLFQRTEPCEICETYTVLKTGKPHHWEWTGPDNRDYDVHDFPFTDSDGAPFILEMGIDVTEIKRAEAALREANETLEQRVAERTAELESFSYTVSHDLRAPLRAIDGYSRMILRKHADKFDEDALDKFNVIRDNTRMMGQLIDDLLAFSRLGRAATVHGDAGHRGTDQGGLGGAEDRQPGSPPDAEDRGDPPVQGRPGAHQAGPRQHPLQRREVHQGAGRGADRSGRIQQRRRDRLLHPGQRRRIRHAVPRQAVRRFPAPPQRRRVRGNRGGTRHRPADHPPARRPYLGGRRDRQGRLFLLFSSPVSRGSGIIRGSSSAGYRPGCACVFKSPVRFFLHRS